MDKLARPTSPPLAAAPCVVPHGDLVVARDVVRPGRFTIRQAPGAPQVSFESQAVALEVAGNFARDHGVDVWLEANAVATCVQRFRPHARPPAMTPLQPPATRGARVAGASRHPYRSTADQKLAHGQRQ